MNALVDTIPTNELMVQKSLRPDEARCLTSGKAGKIIPLKFIPLLREDRLETARLQVKIDMMETAETLMNGVSVLVMAHWVPKLAFERFEGSLDRFNKSYSGLPDKEGGDVVPFYETKVYNSAQELYLTAGIQGKNGDTINTDHVEAYNALVNFRYRARSTKLAQRTALDTTLAPCFWHHNRMAHIVPDFDQAAIDGELELNIAATNLPVKGIGTWNQTFSDDDALYETGATGPRDDGSNWASTNLAIAEDPNNAGFPGVFAELASQGIKLSLSNIELAKKTAAFAAIRKRYAGLDDDAIIDLLMQGIRVPDQQLAQPILLDRKRTLIGYSKRYASDAANLEKSVTTGMSVVNLTMRTPPMNTGGYIIVTCEIVPEQMFERQKDYSMYITDVADLPNATRDEMDPEKVSVVQNAHVDVQHTSPEGTFGYAPLNHEWRRTAPNIGGKYFREVGDPFDEDRQKIWDVETVDPSLTEDFYLVNDLHHDVFADTISDAFEIQTIGNANVVGLTVFGKGLQEDTGDYDALSAIVDDSRIDQDA